MELPAFADFVEKSSYIAFARIDEEVRATGNTKHYVLNRDQVPSILDLVEGRVQPPESSLVENYYGLIIMKEDSENAYYLYYCDEGWEITTDTRHQTLEDAKKQAELEFNGISKKWIVKKPLMPGNRGFELGPFWKRMGSIFWRRSE